MFHIVELQLSWRSLWKLDPTLVLLRICEEFPQTTYCLDDLAWKDYDAFQARRVVSNALKIAENDARRRGPIWGFRIRHADQLFRGVVCRESCWIDRQDKLLPPSLKQNFLAFLRGLEIPGSTIESYVIETGNKRATV